MIDTPLKKFAFTYQVDGKEHLLLIEAESAELAKQRVACMATATFNNEVLESE